MHLSDMIMMPVLAFGFSPMDVVLIVFIFIVLALSFLPTVFYCLTLQKTLHRVSPKNRAMAPGLVWLLCIPLFSLVWHFYVVLSMAKSLGAEFTERQAVTEPAPGKSLGLVLCLLHAFFELSLALPLSSHGVIIVWLCGVSALICWVIYWIKISGYAGKLVMTKV